VLVHGGVVIGGEAAHMRCDAFAAMEDLHRVCCETCVQLLADVWVVVLDKLSLHM
jgi:hypothetical protein